MPHIAVKVNMLIDIDVEPVSEYRRAKVILTMVTNIFNKRIGWPVAEIWPFEVFQRDQIRNLVTWPWPGPFWGLPKKYFTWRVKGKVRSKFGEDRSKTGLTMLAIVAGWTDTGQMDAKMNLYSVQCCRLHWTDNDNNNQICTATYAKLQRRCLLMFLNSQTSH